MFMSNAVVNPLKEDGTPKTPEEIEQEKKALESQPPAPGSKTDSVLLLKSLQEEREFRKQMLKRIQLLEDSSSSEEVQEELKNLKQQIEESNSRIDNLTQEKVKNDLLVAYPVLKEKWEDFEKFRADPENKGMNMRTAARAFLTENGLLDTPRRGLEKPTGGSRAAPSTKMTPEEIKDLRENNYPKYREMLEKGQIEV